MDRVTDKWIEDIRNAPAKYRSTPFWSWNGELDADECVRQIREMRDAGIGGYIMHARGGLLTEYFSPEWFQVINACVAEGERLGMEVWLYDEKGWPSGYAGGAVPREDARFSLHWLELGEDGEVAIHTTPYYVDVMNKKAMEAFIRHTYDGYRKCIGEDAWKTVRGFFTDEPQFARGIPWSPVFPEEFRSRHGDDIFTLLPLLFREGEGSDLFRYRYYSMASELFVDSFFRQIGGWCRENGCEMTGHAMLEDSLDYQMHGTAGVMPSYEYMQQPGIDWLGRRIGNPLTPRQAGSAAAQLSKKFVLSEMFALTGWNVRFSELKAIAEWQYLNGVNKMCQHLESYTLKGNRKRDYPPSLFFQQNWWPEYRIFNDYFAALGKMLADGEHSPDALLIHPIKSAYQLNNGKWGDPGEGTRELDDAFETATVELAGRHIEHHYGDEAILRRHGTVSGGRLVVGKMSYATIFLPDMLSIDGSTLRLLLEFAEEGGDLIALGRLPALLDGSPSDELARLEAAVLRVEIGELSAINDSMGIAGVRIRCGEEDVEALHCTKRVYPDCSVHYIVNLSTERLSAGISFRGIHDVSRLRLEDGSATAADFRHDDGWTILREVVFEPRESMIFVCGSGFASEKERPMPPPIKLGDAWSVKSFGSNAFLLDKCEYRLEGGNWESETFLSDLLDLLIERRYAGRLEMRFSVRIGDDVDLSGMGLALERADRLMVTVNGIKASTKREMEWIDPCFTVLDVGSLMATGSNIVEVSAEYYQSDDFYRVLDNKADVMESEKNMLTYDTELENLYLLGNFGVYSESGFAEGPRNSLFTDGGFYIAPAPTAVQGGKLTESGYCFYTGRISLTQSVICEDTAKPASIDLGTVFAPAARARIGDGEFIPLLWNYRADISGMLEQGENIVEVELISGHRNLFGPFHLKEGETHAVSPYSFNRSYLGDNWTDEYAFVKFGLDPNDDRREFDFEVEWK